MSPGSSRQPGRPLFPFTSTTNAMSYGLDYSEQVHFGMQPFDDDDPESLSDYFPEPDECDKCGAWVDYADDHATDCPHFEERPLSF